MRQFYHSFRERSFIIHFQSASNLVLSRERKRGGFRISHYLYRFLSLGINTIRSVLSSCGCRGRRLTTWTSRRIARWYARWRSSGPSTSRIGRRRWTRCTTSSTPRSMRSLMRTSSIASRPSPRVSSSTAPPGYRVFRLYLLIWSAHGEIRSYDFKNVCM